MIDSKEKILETLETLILYVTLYEAYDSKGCVLKCVHF